MHTSYARLVCIQNNPCLSVPPCTRCAGYTLPRRSTRCQQRLACKLTYRARSSHLPSVTTKVTVTMQLDAIPWSSRLTTACPAPPQRRVIPDREVTCHAMLSARRGHPGRRLCVSVRSLWLSLLSAALLCATVSVYVSTAAAVHIISVTTDYDAATGRVSAAASATTAGGCRPGTGSGAT